MMPAMRRALLPLIFCCAACGLLESGEPGRNEVNLETEKPEAMRIAGWIEFPSLSVHTADQSAAPNPPLVRGYFRGGWFETDGKIEGEIPPLPSRRVLKRGSLLLASRAFVAEGSEIAVRGVAIAGFQDQETGAFHPAPPAGNAGSSK